MKKQGFTLAEIILVLLIVGVIAAVVLPLINSDSINQKTYNQKAFKVVSLFNQAAANIRENKDDCPSGSFIIEAFDEYVKGLVVKGSGGAVSAATSAQAIDIFAKHIKFAQKGINFCDYSSCDDNTIVGGRLPGNMYAGLKILDSITDCPDYYIPGDSTKITPQADLDGKKPKCWAKLYIDVNGNDAPNEENKDIFIYGFGDTEVLF